MGRDALIEQLIAATLDYWDGYYIDGSVLDPIREEMKNLLDIYEKSVILSVEKERKE